MELQQPRPVGLAGGPPLDLVEVGRPVSERVGAPGEEEDVLDGAQVEQVGGDVGDAKDDKAAIGLLDGRRRGRG